MDLLSHFVSCRALSEEICSNLEIEDYSIQPVEFVSPPKWHLGHTTWFFEAFILKEYLPEYPVYDDQFFYLFNSYYEGAGDRILRTKRGVLTRPLVTEVYQYRKHVTHWMKNLLQNISIDKDLQYLIELGINHEQQHQELLFMDIKYIFGNQPLFPVLDADFKLSSESKKDFIEISEGVYKVGFNGEGFAYDNELESHSVYINNFEIATSLVSNGEYLQFVKEGGYQNHNYWLAEGWSYINENNITLPLYWFQQGEDFFQYELSGYQKLNPNLPVSHISLYEAHAFAEWKGMRLPTELEWEVASDYFQWGQLWEWTNSAYLPYPGYKKDEGTIGEYNGKFMVNQKVLRGACLATSPNHSRKTYRNFFHPELRWMFSGIRLVK